jgi:hypothetical protein
MVSKSKQTETVRKRKQRSKGRERKNALENHGSTLSNEELFKVKKES